MRSATVIISSLCCFANFASCGTRAIVPSSFMISQMTPAGYRPGDARQIDGRLGLARADHHAARSATAAGTCGPAAPDRTAASPGRSRPAPSPRGRRRKCRWSCAPWLRSARRTPCRSASCSGHHQRNLELVEPLGRHRQADQPAAVARHEIDGLRRDFLGGDRQVAFVLAVLIVDDDDHPAGADGVERVFDAGERDRRLARALGDLHVLSLQWVTSPRLVPSESPASSAARTTYFPTMSHSRLTRSRIWAARRFVFS